MRFRPNPAAAAALALGLGFGAVPAHAQDCSVAPDTDPYDLSAEAVEALYACVEGAMIDGYTAGDNAVAAAYRDWTVTSTRPAVAGPHGERFLQTFANDVAAGQYTAFESGEFEMPAGSVLAKESFTLSGGEPRPGPLFVMEKVTDAPDFDNWVYSAVQPDGAKMNVGQSFCHDCHGAFSASDSMGYPLPEVRIAAGG